MRTIAITLALLLASNTVSARPRHSAKKPEAPAVVQAKAALKIARAVAKVAKAIEACEQAVVDACVEGAREDGSTDCEDAALKAQFAQCH